MTPSGDRIASLDLIRGVAVMGILLMNIQAFAMPEAAYPNPAAYGGARGADLATWLVEVVLIDGKMRGLFSWLFGASLLLVTDRAEAAGRGAAGVHFRRMAWLLAFGLAHLLLVWDGDILAHYALVGSVAFAFRRWPAHKLVAAALALVLAQMIVNLGTPLAIDQAAERITSGHADAATARDYATWRAQFGVPRPATIRAALALHRGPCRALLAARWAEAPGLVLGTLGSFGLETLAFMLFGMAGLKSGMLADRWPRVAYARIALAAFAIGAPLTAAIALWVVARGFDPGTVAWAATVFTAPLRPPLIAGWACLVLWCSPMLGGLGARIGAAGRMALSNYLATSLVCVGLFDGLGLFGRFGRAELLLVVLAVWALMLLWSRPWLARFRYGPFEWLWRSLARGRLQPMGRA